MGRVKKHRLHVKRGTIVSTDELPVYNLLRRTGYYHGKVNHSAKQWTFYDRRKRAWHHTNHIESFWRLFKVSVESTHIHISGKYMNRYLGEFIFRSNHRQMTNAMFDLLLGAV
jgi:transposase